MQRLAAAICLVFLAASCADKPASGDGTIDDATPTLLEETLMSFRGKPVVVNYWATWCKPCKAEMPRVVAAAKKYEDEVRFLGVNVEDDTEAAAAFAKDYGIPFRSLSDARGDIRRAQKVSGLPVTHFFSADGELAFVHNGEIKTDDLEAKIRDTIRSGG